jgi:hypothetical protein
MSSSTNKELEKNKENLLFLKNTMSANKSKTTTSSTTLERSASSDSLTWDEQVSQEIKEKSPKEKIEKNNKTVTSDLETRKNLQNNEENTTTIITRTEERESNLVEARIDNVNKNNETLKRPWSSLFAKVKRGQSTFSSFSPRNNIKSKNENALILDIQNLNCSLNDIMVSLYETAGRDIVAAKPHINRGARTHLELIFTSKDKLKLYATRGVEIFNRSYYGYIPTDTRRSFLSVKIRNVPLGNKEHISEEIKEAFNDIGKIASIKPLLIEGTPYLTDQWIITFETTDDSDLEERIPRFYILLDNKITTEWRAAPKLCYFCDKEGHIKKECPQYKEAVILRQQHREFLLNKKKGKSTSLNAEKEDVNSAYQISSTENMVIENNHDNETFVPIFNQEENNEVKSSMAIEEDAELSSSENSKSNSEENPIVNNSLSENDLEPKNSELQETPIVLIINDENLQEMDDNLDEEVTISSQRKRKDKKDSTNRKLETNRSAPYKKSRIGAQNTQI